MIEATDFRDGMSLLAQWSMSLPQKDAGVLMDLPHLRCVASPIHGQPCWFA